MKTGRDSRSTIPSSLLTSHPISTTPHYSSPIPFPPLPFPLLSFRLPSLFSPHSPPLLLPTYYSFPRSSGSLVSSPLLFFSPFSSPPLLSPPFFSPILPLF